MSIFFSLISFLSRVWKLCSDVSWFFFFLLFFIHYAGHHMSTFNLETHISLILRSALFCFCTTMLIISSLLFDLFSFSGINHMLYLLNESHTFSSFSWFSTAYLFILLSKGFLHIFFQPFLYFSTDTHWKSTM